MLLARSEIYRISRMTPWFYGKDTGLGTSKRNSGLAPVDTAPSHINLHVRLVAHHGDERRC